MIRYEQLPEGFNPSEMVSAEHNCRTCGQQTYLRPLSLTKPMLAALLVIQRITDDRGFATPKDIKNDPESENAYSVYVRMKYWELIESYGTSGWRITDQGRAFLSGALKIPMTLWIFNDAPRNVYGVDPFGAISYIDVNQVSGFGPTSREEARESLVAIEQE